MTNAQILEIAIILLFIATLVALVTRRLRLPYTVGLVTIGLVLGLVNQSEMVNLPAFIVELGPVVRETITPQIILGILVTPLIFEAAFHLSWDDLRRDLGLILALAVPGVLLTTLLVGVIVSFGADLTGVAISLPLALVFGAMMSATDPVSVVALFRSLGVPKRLQVLIEGESLFNDGTAIVIFALMESIVFTTQTASGGALLLTQLTEFVRVAGGGLVVGLFLGWIVSQMIIKIDDHLIETTLTTVLAFGAYLLAEQLHVSGVLAVVAAGLVNGNIGPRGMSPTTRIVVTNIWDLAAFLSNSFLFLLIGLEMKLDDLISSWQLILLATLAVLLARAVVIYGLALIQRNIPWRWSHVLLWGGLRGAISLALALSLPLSVGNQLQTMVFGVVLFTIVVQGGSMQQFVRRINLVERSEMKEEYERRHARAVAARAAYNHLETMHAEGLYSNHTWDLIAPLLKHHAETLASEVKEVLEADPSVEAEELDTALREGLRAQKSALIGLLKDGVISEEIYSQLVRGIDLELTGEGVRWGEFVMLNSMNTYSVHKLMTAVIQIQDVEKAISALNEAGLSVTRMSSSGGFLGRRNVTLLIGLPEGYETTAVNILSKACRRRVEYIATPFEGAPFHLPTQTPITVGGATIFTFEVERYEEI
jgi:CPA1 family monovalent cation:H+ antiporter